MIVVKLMGGLGNQMFQYAFGKALALKNKTELKLDVSFLGDRKSKNTNTIRDYQLDLYSINAPIASYEDLKKYKKKKLGKIFDMFLFYLPFGIQNLYIREPFFYFYKKALHCPSNSYVDGYWQSERYFDSIRGRLLQEFAPANPLSAETLCLSEKIIHTQSVSIHVRRGDYIADPLNVKRFGVCSSDYYKQALDTIAAKITNPSFFVFSDEPDWFKKNIQTAFSIVFITHNKGSNSYEDMYLMSLCKHNIIANSSFSWWGAWLNKNKEKMVIAPKNWFKNNSKNSKDLLPETWIQL